MSELSPDNAAAIQRVLGPNLLGEPWRWSLSARELNAVLEAVREDERENARQDRMDDRRNRD